MIPGYNSSPKRRRRLLSGVGGVLLCVTVLFVILLDE